MCAVSLFLGFPCPGCGLLHCLWALIQLDWGRAFLLFPIWPLLFLYFPFRRMRAAGVIFLIALFAQWMIRIFALGALKGGFS